MECRIESDDQDAAGSISKMIFHVQFKDIYYRAECETVI